MATLGVARAWVARVDDNFKVITGINGINEDASDKDGKFLIDENTSKGVVSAAVTNLQGSVSDIYGSNKLVELSAAKGAVQTVLTVNALPAAIKERLIGEKSNGNGGYSISGKADPRNRIALLVESQESFGDKPIYMGFYAAAVFSASENMATNDASEKRTTDALTFKHMERGDDGFGMHYYAGDTSFSKEKMFQDIFPTQSQSSSFTPASSASSK